MSHGTSERTKAVGNPYASGVAALLSRRAAANAAFFAAEAERIAELCSRMAERFAAGGRLIAIGISPAARSDVRHVVVEFVHPVIVGKRALPALGLTTPGERLVAELRLLASPRDIVLAFGPAAESERACMASAIGVARARGCLTISTIPVGAEIAFRDEGGDALAWQETVETLYHLLWELVHVFFEHDGDRPSASDPGRAAFLYPFLTSRPTDLDAVRRDVAASVVGKAQYADDLRARTLSSGDAIARVADDVRARLDAGGSVLCFGNGGSATDAMDLVADLRTPPANCGLMPRAAIDLTEDSSILTALANDVGPDLVFARQIEAYGRAGDVAIAFSTSGGSRNVLAALAEARRRGLLTIAFAGYDGGPIAASNLADHVIVAPAEYVPRIQEAHATAYHLMRRTVG